MTNAEIIAEVNAILPKTIAPITSIEAVAFDSFIDEGRGWIGSALRIVFVDGNNISLYISADEYSWWWDKPTKFLMAKIVERLRPTDSTLPQYPNGGVS